MLAMTVKTKGRRRKCTETSHAVAKDYSTLQTFCQGQGSPHTAKAPPEPQDEKRDSDQDSDPDVQLLHVVNQPVPVLSEVVADQRNYADPQEGAEKIEYREALPLHAQDASEGTRDYAQPKDEAREEDRDRAVLLKQPLAALDGRGGNPKGRLISIKQWATTAVSDGESEIVSEGSGADRNHDDVRKV